MRQAAEDARPERAIGAPSRPEARTSSAVAAKHALLLLERRREAALAQVSDSWALGEIKVSRLESPARARHSYEASCLATHLTIEARRRLRRGRFDEEARLLANGEEHHEYVAVDWAEPWGRNLLRTYHSDLIALGGYRDRLERRLGSSSKEAAEDRAKRRFDEVMAEVERQEAYADRPGALAEPALLAVAVDPARGARPEPAPHWRRMALGGIVAAGLLVAILVTGTFGSDPVLPDIGRLAFAPAIVKGVNPTGLAARAEQVREARIERARELARQRRIAAAREARREEREQERAEAAAAAAAAAEQAEAAETTTTVPETATPTTEAPATTTPAPPPTTPTAPPPADPTPTPSGGGSGGGGDCFTFEC